MGSCERCGRDMKTAEGCVEHNVLLEDGRVIESPIHSDENSLSDDPRCGDCGAELGGIHHSRCDWARKPDGSQILKDALAYWDPETEVDPREEESEYVFIITDVSESWQTNIVVFDNFYAAEEYVEGSFIESDLLEIDCLSVRSEADPLIG